MSNSHTGFFDVNTPLASLFSGMSPFARISCMSAFASCRWAFTAAGSDDAMAPSRFPLMRSMGYMSLL